MPTVADTDGMRTVQSNSVSIGYDESEAIHEFGNK